MRSAARSVLLPFVLMCASACQDNKTEAVATGGNGGGASNGGAGQGGSAPLENPSLPPPTGGPSVRAKGAMVPSVCGHSAAVEYSEPGADGLVDVPANDPNIHYMGRVDCSDPTQVSFAYPAVSIRVRFEGNAVDLRLRDYGQKGETVANYYEVVLDGVHQKLKVSPSETVYPLGRELGAGEHELEIWKRVESGPGGRPSQGRGDFLGLRIEAGNALLPVVAKTRAIEVIGDSITCGYGNEISTTTPDDFKYTTLNSNAYLAYGAVAARALDAEYVAVAASGRGVSRNFDSFPGLLVPAMWKLTLPENPSAPAWDFHAFTPDAVIINLGTNDFSPPAMAIDLHAFKQSYVTFLAEVRNVYPEALIVTALGPMLSDYYPPGILAWTEIQAAM
ncbi:MAG TPA: SGNH/GDSL hydrolase family protein, partial [Polyangiaceae bacterium]|nr:SGNH/GDSL hydrolase family protein [Polyangiaceae bacterium]